MPCSAMGSSQRPNLARVDQVVAASRHPVCATRGCRPSRCGPVIAHYDDLHWPPGGAKAAEEPPSDSWPASTRDQVFAVGQQPERVCQTHARPPLWHLYLSPRGITLRRYATPHKTPRDSTCVSRRNRESSELSRHYIFIREHDPHSHASVGRSVPSDRRRQPPYLHVQRSL